jgi:hypothetical protein
MPLPQHGGHGKAVCKECQRRPPRQGLRFKLETADKSGSMPPVEGPFQGPENTFPIP